MNKIMNKTTLAFALAGQLALIAVLLAVRAGSAVEPEPFLDFAADAVDGLTIANEEGAVTLAKTDAGWQLPSGIPADDLKVERVLEKLADAKSGWPVGTTASIAERFEVTEENHQRHVTLNAGEDTVAELYLGTSPGFRKAHARRVDDDDVFSITFSNYEAGVEEGEWLDKSLLRAEGDVTALRREGGFELTKDDDGVWTAASGAALDQGKVETLAGRFTGLSVLGVGDAALPESPKAVFKITDDAGTATFSLYQVGEAAEEGEEDAAGEWDDYAATSDRIPGVYEVSSYIAEQMDVTVDALAPDAAEEDEPQADETESDPAPTPDDEEADAEAASETGAAP